MCHVRDASDGSDGVISSSTVALHLLEACLKVLLRLSSKRASRSLQSLSHTVSTTAFLFSCSLAGQISITQHVHRLHTSILEEWSAEHARDLPEPQAEGSLVTYINIKSFARGRRGVHSGISWLCRKTLCKGYLEYCSPASWLIDKTGLSSAQYTKR